MPFFLLSFIWVTFASADELRLVFDDLKSTDGTIKYLIFKGEKGFPDRPEKKYLEGSLAASKFHSGVGLKLPSGNYALSVIHDENDNDQLDKNFLGIPKEGFGFSNNPKIFFGPPSYEKASFDSKDHKIIKIKMNYL